MYYSNLCPVPCNACHILIKFSFACPWVCLFIEKKQNTTYTPYSLWWTIFDISKMVSRHQFIIQLPLLCDTHYQDTTFYSAIGSHVEFSLSTLALSLNFLFGIIIFYFICRNFTLKWSSNAFLFVLVMRVMVHITRVTQLKLAPNMWHALPGHYILFYYW